MLFIANCYVFFPAGNFFLSTYGVLASWLAWYMWDGVMTFFFRWLVEK